MQARPPINAQRRRRAFARQNRKHTPAFAPEAYYMQAELMFVLPAVQAHAASSFVRSPENAR
jgi:hypothetical protein